MEFCAVDCTISSWRSKSASRRAAVPVRRLGDPFPAGSGAAGETADHAVGAEVHEPELDQETAEEARGLGLRLDIPMFPVRLDFATPIEKPDHADEEVFSFTVGYDF